MLGFNPGLMQFEKKVANITVRDLSYPQQTKSYPQKITVAVFPPNSATYWSI
jgi:hypothetical protein